MDPSMYYLPLVPIFILSLALLFTATVLLIELGIINYAYHKMGVESRYVFAVLLLSLIGSAINIPIYQSPSPAGVSPGMMSYFGARYAMPDIQNFNSTILAVNVGGAVIPSLLSLYLMIKNRIYVSGILATAIVSLVVHAFAAPLPNVGIAVPTLLPGVVAALAALIISRRQSAPIAYIAGSMGTLIGADLLNLAEITSLGVPVASIGGAGTYDGIFLSGIIAVLLA